MIVISGMFYFIPSVAAVRLLLAPHEIKSACYIAFDFAKLSYLIGKGVICKLVQIKNCILAIK